MPTDGSIKCGQLYYIRYNRQLLYTDIHAYSSKDLKGRFEAEKESHLYWLCHRKKVMYRKAKKTLLTSIAVKSINEKIKTRVPFFKPGLGFVLEGSEEKRVKVRLILAMCLLLRKVL